MRTVAHSGSHSVAVRVVLATLAAGAIGCGAAEPQPGGPRVADETLGGVFSVTSMRTAGVEQPVADVTELVIDTEFGSLSIETSCGRLLGSFSFLVDGRAGVTIAGGRRRDCAPAAQEQQDRLLAVLSQVDSWARSGGELSLSSLQGDRVALAR